jgi:hypothetical protein
MCDSSTPSVVRENKQEALEENEQKELHGI